MGADGPVVPDGGVEGQEALDDPGPQARRDAAAVAAAAELALEGPDGRLDALAQPAGEGAGRLVFAGGADQLQAQGGQGSFESRPAKPLSATITVPAGGKLGWRGEHGQGFVAFTGQFRAGQREAGDNAIGGRQHRLAPQKKQW